ncbi:hypothetical protein Tco_0768415 [Tanacetum coccineum]
MEQNSSTKWCLNTIKDVVIFHTKVCSRTPQQKRRSSKDVIDPEPFIMSPGQPKSGLAPNDKEHGDVNFNHASMKYGDVLKDTRLVHSSARDIVSQTKNMCSIYLIEVSKLNCLLSLNGDHSRRSLCQYQPEGICKTKTIYSTSQSSEESSECGLKQ